MVYRLIVDITLRRIASNPHSDNDALFYRSNVELGFPLAAIQRRDGLRERATDSGQTTPRSSRSLTYPYVTVVSSVLGYVGFFSASAAGSTMWPLLLNS